MPAFNDSISPGDMNVGVIVRKKFAQSVQLPTRLMLSRLVYAAIQFRRR